MAKILVVGFDGTGVELVKNTVLAGVGSVTVQDCRIAEVRDLGSNFFLTADCVGSNVRLGIELAIALIDAGRTKRTSTHSGTQPSSRSSSNFGAC